MNGADGIGTGWATKVPQYNPREIVQNLKAMMNGQEPQPMVPWYKGYQGAIEKVNDKTCSVGGSYEIVDDETLKITELPIGKWTKDYKTFIEE